MICTKCNHRLPDDSEFCQFCGNRIEKEEIQQNSTQKEKVTDSSKLSFATQDKPLGMAWYKFLVNFSLIAGAIINIIFGLSYISGGIYLVQTNGEVSAKEVYAYYGTGVQNADVLYGFFLIAIAVLAFTLRYKLVNYKPDSLKFVQIFYWSSALVPFLYECVIGIIAEQTISGTSIMSLFIGLILLLINIIYFDKRSHLFVDKAISEVKPVQTSSSNSINNANSFSENSLTFDTTVISNERMMEGADFVKSRVDAVKKGGTEHVSTNNNNVFVADELLKLKQLLDMGILSQEEFNEQKNKVLNK